MKKCFFTIIAVLIVSVLIISFITGNVEGRPSFGTNCEGCHALQGNTSQEVTSSARERVSSPKSIQRQTEMVAKMENQVLILKEINKQILDLQAVYETANAEGASKTAELVEALIIERQQTFQNKLVNISKIPDSQVLLFNDELYDFRIY